MRIALSALLLLLAACGPAAPPHVGGPPGSDCQNTEIVCSYDGGAHQLYCLDPPRRLLDTSPSVGGPASGYAWAEFCQ